MPLFLIVVTSLGLTFDVIIPNAYSLSYNEQISNKTNNMWQLGKNLEIGDSYTYKICDPGAILNYSAESYHYFTKNLEHNSSLCYTVTLNFANLISSDENQINSDIWIVQATIVDYFSGEIRNSIFHIDADSWNVRSADTIHPDTARYADSIQNTLFSLHKYTAQESKLLQEEIKWGEVTEYHDLMQDNPYMAILDDQLKFEVTEFVRLSILSIDNLGTPQTRSLDVSSVGYEIDIIDVTEDEDNDVTNSYLVNSDLSFPVKAVYYSPSHIVEPFKEYEFQLISFFDMSNTLESNSINADAAVGNDDDTTDDDHVIVESGTIELTFPDVDNDIDDTVENMDDTVDNTEDQNYDNDIIETDDTIQNNDDSIDNVEDQNDDNTTDTKDTNDVVTEDSKPKSSSMTLLVLIIGIALAVGIFVYLKKFRKNNSASFGVFGKNDDDNSKTQIPEKKMIQFDESITIDILSKDSEVIS